jgi:hypothetical protein
MNFNFNKQKSIYEFNFTNNIYKQNLLKINIL